jgi:prephenate dehydrogenase
MPEIPRIGLLGYGRFGAALATLLEERGHRWCCWDPVARLPPAHAASDVDSLLAQSELVIVAVPVGAFEAVLRDLRPRLHARHQVMDVGSVKLAPCRLMDEVLGDGIGHVGAHPLFGPLSIARAEPLRTIVCPSPRHPSTARLACELFTSIGSEVDEQDPARHDQHMALTHAMAFFIARGLLDLGVGNDLRWTPPSFAALAASIAAVRADAGHLFHAIQRENPYAAATRGRLIEALGNIDRQLAMPSTRTDPVEPGIPDSGLPPPAPGDTRSLIDELDLELIALLQRRCELSARARRTRAGPEAGRLDPVEADAGGEAALLSERVHWAELRGLPAESMRAVFRQVLDMGRHSRR